MVKQCIVESISPRHVGRLLQEAQLKPHQIRTPPDEEFDAKVSDITQLYMSALEQSSENAPCVSTESTEMTGIQASNVLPQTYHYGLVKFNGESLSISVMEHKA